MEPVRSDIDRFAPIPVLIMLGVVAVCLASDLLVNIPQITVRNYNEGWGALWADTAMAGGAIYPPMDAFIANNYPPLSFYITGALGLLTGDNIFAGRMIATASVLCVGAWVWLLARTLGASLRWAAAATLVFLLFAIGVFRTYFAMSDPQWLAHAISTPALLLLMRRPPSELSAGRLAAAAALILLAGLIKHSVAALPVAVTLWLAWHDRRRLVVWLAICAALLAVALPLLWGIWGENLFRGILEHSRQIRVVNLLLTAREMACMAPLFAGAALLAFYRGREPGVRLVLIFGVVASVWGAVQRLGEGVGDNAHIEMLIAFTVAASVGVPAALASGRWRGHGRLASLAAAVLCLPLAGVLAYGLSQAPGRLAGAVTSAPHWEELIAEVAARPGPAMCVPLSVCYWAGKGFEFDAFSYGERLRTGNADPAQVEALMRGGRLKQIIVERERLEEEWDSGDRRSIVAAMRPYYRPQPTAVDEYVVMLPAR